MKTLTRDEFISLTDAKKPKIITLNREIIFLTLDQALDWYNDTVTFSGRIGFIAEGAFAAYLGYAEVNPKMESVIWHKIGGSK